MKISAISLFLLTSTAAVAQNYQGMNEADMQNMMEQMQQMQSCMADVDQDELKALEQRANQFEAEVKSLCNNGKRDEAQQKAFVFAKEIAKDPTIATMRKCGEMAQGTMPPMPFEDQQDDGSEQHVCD